MTCGRQLPNGDQALAFVRERYAFIDGDYQRVKNQQIFLSALLRTILAPATRTNSLKMTALVDELAPYVGVDSGLDAAALRDLVLGLAGIRGANVASLTLPSRGMGTSADGQSILLRDDATIALARALSEDSVGGLPRVGSFGLAGLRPSWFSNLLKRNEQRTVEVWTRMNAQHCLGTWPNRPRPLNGICVSNGGARNTLSAPIAEMLMPS